MARNPEKTRDQLKFVVAHFKTYTDRHLSEIAKYNKDADFRMLADAVLRTRRVKRKRNPKSRAQIIRTAKARMKGLGELNLRGFSGVRQTEKSLKAQLKRARTRTVKPKGKLPNPKTGSRDAFGVWHAENPAGLKASYLTLPEDRARVRSLFIAANVVRASKATETQKQKRLLSIGRRLQALEDKALKVLKTNPEDADWYDIADEAARLGDQQARALGHSRRHLPKLYKVTWYSPLRKKRTGFIRPIEAHTAAEAKRQAKAMVENDPKANNFVAKEVERNPKRPPMQFAGIYKGHKITKDLLAGYYYVPSLRISKKNTKEEAQAAIDEKVKPNPSVNAIAEKFQGKADGALETLKAANGCPKNVARAGKLVFLKTLHGAQTRTWRIPGAVVCISPSEKLWIAGTHAPMFQTKAKKGQGFDVGEVHQICYETAKSHIGGGKTYEYVHEFGEDGGKRPHLIIDSEGMPILRGGDYKIKAEGIVN